MRKILLLIATCISFAYADFSKHTIAESLKQVAREEQIDVKLLYSIAKIESNFEPLIVAFTSGSRNYHFKNAKVSVKSYKDKYLIQVRADEYTLKDIVRKLINAGINVDVGIMQINSINFSDNELNHIFKPKYNIQKSTQVLKNCNAKFFTLKETIECYNKGFRKKKTYDYYTKVKDSFLASFGGIK